MVDPINLNRARKAKKRAEKDQRAKENRIKFGRTKAEKARDQQQAERSRNVSEIRKSDE